MYAQCLTRNVCEGDGFFFFLEMDLFLKGEYLWS